jgi:hypothetical protein
MIRERGLSRTAHSGRIVGNPEAIHFIRYSACPETGLLRSSRGLLAAILPLFPRRLQLPIPLGLNLLLVPGEHVPSA